MRRVKSFREDFYLFPLEIKIYPKIRVVKSHTCKKTLISQIFLKQLGIMCICLKHFRAIRIMPPSNQRFCVCGSRSGAAFLTSTSHANFSSSTAPGASERWANYYPHVKSLLKFQKPGRRIHFH